MKNPVTLAQIRRWPPTCNVADAATALGVSRASAYQSIAEGTFPVRTIVVRRRLKVITASLIAQLSADSETAGPAA